MPTGILTDHGTEIRDITCEITGEIIGTLELPQGIPDEVWDARTKRGSIVSRPEVLNEHRRRINTAQRNEVDDLFTSIRLHLEDVEHMNAPAISAAISRLEQFVTEYKDEVVGEAPPVPVDNEPPTVEIIRPVEGAILTGRFRIEIGATDNIGVSRIDISVNGSLAASLSTPPFVINYDSTGLVNGPLRIAATAYDVAENSAVASVNVMLQAIIKPPGP